MTTQKLTEATKLSDSINKKESEQKVVKALLEAENLEKIVYHEGSATIPDKIYRKMLEETLIHLNQEWIELQNDFNDL